MDVKAEKLKIIHQLLTIEDKNLLYAIRNLIEAGLANTDFSPPADFWKSLSERHKADILLSINQLREGKGIPHEVVMQEMRTLLQK